MKNCNRNGSTYVIVLLTSAIVSLIALGSFSLSQIHRKSSIAERDYIRSESLADSGLEQAIAWIGGRPEWRAKFVDGFGGGYVDSISLGNGAVRWKISDPADDDLENLVHQPIKIQSTGKTGFTRSSKSLLVFPAGAPLDAMATSLTCSGELQINGSLNTALPVATNEIINGFAACDVHASTFNGTVVEGVSTIIPNAPQMPSNHIFEAYAMQASSFGFFDLPAGSLEESTISNSQAPENAATQPNGVYYIEVPANQTLFIRNCDLKATLVVRLAGDQSKLIVEGNTSWMPHHNGLPALVVKAESDNGTEIQLGTSNNTSVGTVQLSPFKTNNPVNKLLFPQTIFCSYQVDFGGVGTGSPLPEDPDPIDSSGASSEPSGASDPSVSDPTSGGDQGTGGNNDQQEPYSPDTTTDITTICGVVHVIRESGSSSQTILNEAAQIYGVLAADGNVTINGSVKIGDCESLRSAPPTGYQQSLTGNNLLQNYDMESGIQHWISHGQNVNLSWHLESGNRSLHVSNRNASTSGFEQDITQRIESNESLTMEFDVKPTQASDAFYGLIEYVTENGTFFDRVMLSSSGSNWQTLSAALTPTWSGTLVQAKLIIHSSSTSDFYIDNISLNIKRHARSAAAVWRGARRIHRSARDCAVLRTGTGGICSDHRR